MGSHPHNGHAQHSPHLSCPCPCELRHGGQECSRLRPHGSRVKNIERRNKKKRFFFLGSPDPAASAARGPGPFPRAGQDPVTGPQPFRGRPSHRTAPGSEARSLPAYLPYCMYSTVTIKSRAFAYFVQGFGHWGLRSRPPTPHDACPPAQWEEGRGAWAVQVDHRMKRGWWMPPPVPTG